MMASTIASQATSWRVGARESRAGFTLVEVLVVLTVLVLAFSAAWPAVTRPLARTRVTQAARQLVDDLATARRWAIETARPIEFVYELNGGHYRIGPSATVSGDRRAGGFEELSAQSASDEAHRRPAESIPVAREDVVADRDTLEHRLTDGLRFSVSPAVPAASVDSPLDRSPGKDVFAAEKKRRGMRDQSAERGGLDDEGAHVVTWSEPIRFFPDGRCDPARLTLAGEKYDVAVTLRRLTGQALVAGLARRSRTPAPNDAMNRGATDSEEYPSRADRGRTE